MKKVIIIVISIWLLGFAVYVFASQDSGNCSPSGKSKSLTMPNNEIICAKLAVTAGEKSSGLSGVSAMVDYDSMLFIYEEPQSVSFWMNEMKFALDIIYLDENKTVLEIYKNEKPCESGNVCPIIPAETSAVKYVLELPAGKADLFGLKINLKIKWQ
ncbi:DUF192 domain-containing protein [Patescibacteria group bacterium]|nr:DUF192 domain-containing protein [Patescibacteria group bacterium]